jgi:hypothetical protein
MHDQGFFDMVPGSIGTINYFVNVSDKLTPEQKQAIVSKQANARLRAALMNGALDPAEAYATARNDSWGELNSQTRKEMREVAVQIGNKESYEHMKKVEKSKDFVEWANPLLVSIIKETFESAVNGKEDNKKTT